ncbi:MAG: glutathione S-transferase family protein [Rhodobacteraceae bacterium]|nr:MAG: glutathione S-transferase family protein [Paracoccaceae bacterium]
MTPTLWGRATSVNVQKVMWALAECEIAHTRIDAGGRFGRTESDEFGAMTPLRRVPVWQEDGLTLWESHAILRHLARGPAAALWPETSAERATADQWIEFTTTTLLPPLIGVFYQKVRLALPNRSADLLSTHLGGLDAALDILDARLADSPWVSGPSFSIADIAAGSPMYRYFTMDIPRPHRPALADWYARLTRRSAYRETVMTSYDELRGA